MPVKFQRFLLLILFLVFLALISRFALSDLWLIVIGAISCAAFVMTGRVYR